MVLILDFVQRSSATFVLPDDLHSDGFFALAVSGFKMGFW